ncbi:transglutaminase family protein [Streptomyces sp. GC420]|uniref:transglutaminase-like domain-containing protein n=1 Tax=Streptomyces sp. GC420 TaxID=2697568 RepID=UPI001414F217|nr:transglutaminase family protein [Streptomyces sp. GC420]NBM14735.1 transglutaminase [Streptomyces sp. GC420]
MELIQEVPRLAAYLAADDAIDHRHPLVLETAARLRAQAPDAYSYARAAFEFVRDTVTHSHDAGDHRVTWRASDVLEQGTGICYAKTHALAALLRARSIPAGLCYQLLADDKGGGHVVHGLVALRLPEHGMWARQDPRGNKPGVDARFSLDEERLAWTVRPELGEVDGATVHAAPHPVVLAALRSAPDGPALWKTLPTAL